MLQWCASSYERIPGMQFLPFGSYSPLDMYVGTPGTVQLQMTHAFNDGGSKIHACIQEFLEV